MKRISVDTLKLLFELIDVGHKQKEVATKLGISQSLVSRYIKLRKMFCTLKDHPDGTASGIKDVMKLSIEEYDMYYDEYLKLKERLS